MLLAHLIPFLDAEIDRLQCARDLLAQLSFSGSTAGNVAHAVALSSPLSTQTQATPDLTASLPAPRDAATAVMPVPHVIVLKPHRRNAERTPRRRKLHLAVDTALRGSVPTGPVAVSAQAVRQAQESKSAQAGKPTAESLPSLEWRPRTNDTQTVEALLLRKLLDIGSGEDTAHSSASEQLTRFMHS